MEIATGIGSSLYDVLKDCDSYPALSRVTAKIKQFIAVMEDIRAKSETLALNELFEYCMRTTGYVEALALDKETYFERTENLNELSSNLLKYEQEYDEATLSGFLEEVALMTDIDNYNSDSDTVTLMTLHSAKGLEFPNVFIVGMEEGIFPGMQSMYTPSEIEEERRLAYVGITRAKKKLYLTNAKSRMIFGSTNHNRPSRFIGEIPDGLIDDISRKSITREQQIRFSNTYQTKQNTFESAKSFGAGEKTTSISNDFRIGDTVKHKAFGKGVILSSQRIGNDTLLEIAFENNSTKKLMAKFAKLEKI